MSRIRLVACYAGLLAGAAAPDFSAAVPIRSAAVSPHHRSPNIRASSLAQVAAQPSAADKTKECLPILNTLRTEGLNGLLEELVEAENDEVSEIEPLPKSAKSVTDIAKELAGSDESCEGSEENQYSGLVITFDYSTDFDCKALINESFAAGLSHLEKANYDATAETNKLGTAPLNDTAAKNLAAIVSKKAAKVACAATSGCTAGKNVLYCYFKEALEKEEANPIDADVYEALLKRQRGSASTIVPGITATLFSLALVLLS